METDGRLQVKQGEITPLKSICRGGPGAVYWCCPLTTTGIMQEDHWAAVGAGSNFHIP